MRMRVCTNKNQPSAKTMSFSFYNNNFYNIREKKLRNWNSNTNYYNILLSHIFRDTYFTEKNYIIQRKFV